MSHETAVGWENGDVTHRYSAEQYRLSPPHGALSVLRALYGFPFMIFFRRGAAVAGPDCACVVFRTAIAPPCGICARDPLAWVTHGCKCSVF